MKKIAIKFDFLTMDETDNYLLNIDGIKTVKFNDENDEITIEYDDKVIPLNVLIKEVYFSTGTLNVPTVVSFNKYSTKDLCKYTFNINNLCCEYCLSSCIETLLELEAVISAYSDFDYDNRKSVVHIFIEYDCDNISNEELIGLNSKFNS